MEVLRAERRATREAPPEVLERHARAVAQLEQEVSRARNDLAVLRATADKVCPQASSRAVYACRLSGIWLSCHGLRAEPGRGQLVNAHLRLAAACMLCS